MRATYYNKDKRKYSDLSYESKYLLDPKYMTKRDLQHYYRYYNSVAKGQKQFTKVILIVFCICFFAYILVDYNLRTKLIQLRDRFEFIARMDADYNVTQAYFVDTPGCRIPFFDVTNYRILQYMSSTRPVVCRAAPTRTSDTGATLWWTMHEPELQRLYKVVDPQSIDCNYMALHRFNDSFNNLTGNAVPFRLTFNQSLQIQPGIELIRVECREGTKKPFYLDYHFFALNKSSPHAAAPDIKGTAAETVAAANFTAKLHAVRPLFDRVSFRRNSGNRRRASGNGERLSVMVLGIDSVSHLNFRRQMNRAADYIQKNLTHTEFWGFNKVGDNTYPNLVPMLSGLDESELSLSCLASGKVNRFDNCPFVWKRFKKAGFQTAFCEDVAKISLFNFDHGGFENPPTDYYLRPVVVEMEKHIGYNTDVNVQLCKAGRRTVDVLLEMIRKLVPYLQTQDFFSFFWAVSMSHDRLNTPKLLDDSFINLFRLFESTGVFNKTIVFLMSDHGIRWGSFRKTYQGMMEERLPLLIAIYPDWLKQSYVGAFTNLQNNAKQLTTFYDLYATLLDLIDLRSIDATRLEARTKELAEMEPLPRGISLFLPIPASRTCEQAGIASHWCTCHQHTELPTNDGRVHNAARYVVRRINDRLKSHPQCRTLYLNSILQATIAAPHYKIVQNITTEYSSDITLRLQTKPGLAIFESTVRQTGYAYALTGTISRINLYGSQSYCIDEYALKMFCYCHR